MKPGDTNDEHTPTVAPALLSIPPIGDPTEAAAQRERPIADGTAPAPDLTTCR
jgi:hypothetical protein